MNKILLGLAAGVLAVSVSFAGQHKVSNTLAVAEEAKPADVASAAPGAEVQKDAKDVKKENKDEKKDEKK